PRFGASIVSLTGRSGILFGGMTQDGLVLDDFWTWDLNQREDGSMFMQPTNRTEKLRASTSLSRWLGRFGTSTNTTAWGILVLGGISLEGCIPQQYEIMLLNSDSLVSWFTDGPLDKSPVLSAI